MAEFHGIFCRPFLRSVLIRGVGGMGDGVGWGGVGQQVMEGVGGCKHHPL